MMGSDEYGVVEDSDLELLKIEEKNLLFPPRFQLEFKLTDRSIASKFNKVTIQVTTRQVKINIWLETSSKDINRVFYVIFDYYNRQSETKLCCLRNTTKSPR